MSTPRRFSFAFHVAIVAGFLICDRTAPAQTPEGYANPATCAACHDGIASRYARTGMARTFGAVHSGTASGQLSETTWFHAASAETFSVTRSNGQFQIERHQLGFDGSNTNIVQAAIDYWFGSGNHARSYISRTNRDELIELPLTWYPENHGYWAMSPGYDSPSHAGFSRKITYRCMFCHNAYPKMTAGADSTDNGTRFPKDLPQGIDCQRCHGPAQNHVNAAIAGRPAGELRSLVINPARLPQESRDEVCLQCHLEPTSTSLPSYLPVYGRSVFSYVPGQPLDQYIRYFDHAPNTGHDDKFEFTDAPYRLRKSKCFAGSQGALTCITCHDPHEPDKAQSVARANAACVNCHRARIAALGQRHPASGECVSCHMPQRRPSDSIHVTITDHYIQRSPASLADPKVELNSANTPPYRGEVVPYYPHSESKDAAKDLYTAVAQVIGGANREAGIPRLEKAIAATKPANAAFYTDLADAYRHAGNSFAALPYYEQARSHDAAYWPAIHGLGLALAATGDLNGSLAPLRQAMTLSGGDSAVIRSLASVLTNMGRRTEAIAVLREGVAGESDSSELRNDLGTALLRQGDLEGAEQSLREAVRLRPESAAIRTNLANLLVRLNRFEEARFEFLAAIRTDDTFTDALSGYGTLLASQRQFAEARGEFEAALKINPLLPNVHNNLGAVLRELGDFPGAEAAYRAAIRIEPRFATALFNLAVVLESQKKVPEAVQELLEAIRITPDYFAAHLKVGEFLIGEHKPQEALSHLQKAAASPDKNVSDAASALIKGLKP